MFLGINSDSMARSLDVGHVAETLPDLHTFLADPRLRPIGVVGGSSLVVVGALLQLSPWSTFWSSVVAGVLVFVGVPLFCVGLAAPEPAEPHGLLTLGIDLTPDQRRAVANGSLLVLISPVTVATLGPLFDFAVGVWLAAALLALVGSVLILTGFIAWTSRRLGETTPSR
jgi:hypothetical protein